MTEDPKQSTSPDSAKPENPGEILGAFIQKLEELEKLVTLYEQGYPCGEVDHRGLNTGADKYWSKNIQPLVVEIELDLTKIYNQHIAPHVRYEDQYRFIGGAGLIPSCGDDLYSSIVSVVEARKHADIQALILCMRKGLICAEMKAKQAAPKDEPPPEPPPPAVQQGPGTEDAGSEEAGGQAGEMKGTEDEASPQNKPRIKEVKEPPKEAQQAYRLYHGTGWAQSKVAEEMTNQLKRPVTQGQVSRWVKQYKVWRSAAGIPVDDKKPQVITNTDILDMGARTDGKITGDARHKHKPSIDFDDDHNQ